MGTTRFLKNYTQQGCEQALNEGISVGVVGSVCPVTDKIDTPHRVQEVKEGDRIIGYIIHKLDLSQSDDWGKYFNLIKEKPGQRIPGFPFSVRWPKMYGGKKYQIITVGGEIFEARVDDSREYMSEGLEWNTEEGNKEKQLVAAWKELWQR
ncbi:MAG: hypothetical protein QY321_01770 [Patescibacteria group bacterium]|nr:MAG: hypothetical protein QY321_01770 [Patescibacteria group bacterium]